MKRYENKSTFYEKSFTLSRIYAKKKFKDGTIKEIELPHTYNLKAGTLIKTEMIARRLRVYIQRNSIVMTKMSDVVHSRNDRVRSEYHNGTSYYHYFG